MNKILLIHILFFTVYCNRHSGKCWDADLTHERTLLGLGYLFGVGYIFQLNKRLAITFEASYLSGQAAPVLRGSYQGDTSG